MARVCLGDVAWERRETCGGDRSGCPIVGLEHLEPGEVTLTAWEKGGATTFSKRFYKGDVLFGRRRAYLKKAAAAPFDGICSGDITVITPDQERLSPSLLPFIVQNEALFRFAADGSAGSLSPRVKWDYLRRFSFQLPEREKQENLARALWAIDDTVRAYRKWMAETDNLLKAQFSGMFQSGNFPTVPLSQGLDLEIHTLGSLKGEYETIKYIDISCIDNTLQRVTSYTEYPIDGAPSRAQQVLKKGDILVSTVRPNLRNIAVNPYEEGNVIGSTGLCVLRCRTWMPEYVWGVVTSDGFTRSLCRAASGISYPAVRDGDILRYPVPDAPRGLQRAFADLVRHCETSKEEMERAISELKELSRKIVAEHLG